MIAFELEREARVRLSVYDVRGRLRRALATGTLPPGHHRLAWDGRDAAGREVPAGTYFCRLRAGGRSRVARWVLVR
jgi:flagellar hook assembly protein FlgD